MLLRWADSSPSKTTYHEGNSGMRLALIGASLVLVGGMAAACGGSPDDASEEDFCDAWTAVGESGGDWDKFEDARDGLEDTGTPEDMEDDARDGFEYYLDAMNDVDEDDFNDEDYEPEEPEGDDKDNVEAFITYAMDTCSGSGESGGEGGGSTEEESPSEMPTDMSELPTDMSEMPTDLSEMPTELPSDLESQLSELTENAS